MAGGGAGREVTGKNWNPLTRVRPRGALAADQECQALHSPPLSLMTSSCLLPPPSRCIGSIQHLKSKFGKDYLLEMKVKTLAQVEALHGEILRLFPLAARQER